MTLQELIAECDRFIPYGVMLTVVCPDNSEPLSMFPGAVHVALNSKGTRVHSYNCTEVKKWAENMLKENE